MFSRSLPPPDDVENQVPEDEVKIEEYASSPQLPRPQVLSSINPSAPEIIADRVESPANVSDSGVNSTDSNSNVDTVSTHSTEEGERFIPQNRKWATRWYWQFLVLMVRTFRQSRHDLLSPLNVLQAVLLSIVVALVWFQVPKLEPNISDGYGYVSGCSFI